jgi:hypothetical protein
VNRERWEQIRLQTDSDLGIDLSADRWATLRIGLLLKAKESDDELRWVDARRTFLTNVGSTSLNIGRSLGILIGHKTSELSDLLLRLDSGTRRELFPFLTSFDRTLR